jgi:hypothetical protein
MADSVMLWCVLLVPAAFQFVGAKAKAGVTSTCAPYPTKRRITTRTAKCLRLRRPGVLIVPPDHESRWIWAMQWCPRLYTRGGGCTRGKTVTQRCRRFGRADSLLGEPDCLRRRDSTFSRVGRVGCGFFLSGWHKRRARSCTPNPSSPAQTASGRFRGTARQGLTARRRQLARVNVGKATRQARGCLGHLTGGTARVPGVARYSASSTLLCPG